jgi:catechol 2,3-dioxygenase-like lactoylglutathione lyase family enzyme
MKHRTTLLTASAIALLSMTVAQSQQAPATDATIVPPVKALAMMFASIPSSDIERSIAFYTKGLGMTVRGQVEMGKVIEVPLMFPGGGAYLLLQQSKTTGTPLPTRGSLNRIALIVPDLKALQDQLKAAGYPLKGPINEMAQYRVSVAHVEDPDGNHLELIQRN